MTFNITILGSNSAIPTLKRNPTSQLINHNERLLLVDCAEGTQLQLRKFRIKMQRIHHIFISHLHGDHFFGLIGLISSMHLLGRIKELHIYGPPELKEILDLQLSVSQTELNYPLKFHPLEQEKKAVIYEDEKLSIETLPLNHRIPTCGFLFREKPGKRKIIRQKIKDLNIPAEKILEIKNGADFIDEEGNLHKNDSISTPPGESRTYAYCSDTSYFEPLIPMIKNVDLLYHEATFLHDKAEVAAEKFHATAKEAATIAKKANVKRLLIGHFSNRYDNPELLLDEAKEVFPSSELAMDGVTIEV
ncbi:MAG: ribonuclease Z [Bacteroidales bacterium]|nr:ribonuclease Z [Bacteroidales bacterium]